MDLKERIALEINPCLLLNPDKDREQVLQLAEDIIDIVHRKDAENEVMIEQRIAESRTADLDKIIHPWHYED